MNRTHLVLLFAVLGLALFYTRSKVEKLESEEAEYQAKRYFPNLKDSEVESISVVCTDPNFDYVLQRNGDRWYLDGHLASQEKSPQLVDSLVTITTEREIKASSEPADDAEYGFDSPTYTIALTANGGKELGTILLGDRTPGANHFYGRWQQGGAISTVPTYLFSPLEEEPEKLREMSPFPVEAAAVDRFEWESRDGTTLKVERPKEDGDGFVFAQASDGAVDETRVSDAIYLLKDMKVARFLADSEKTDLGDLVVRYRAHEAGSSVDFVSEIYSPVAVTPGLRYGKRYLTDPGKSEPRAGTEERFVIEMASDSKVLRLTRESFQDRRVAKLEVDKVRQMLLETPEYSLSLKRLPQGGWQVVEPQDRLEEANLAARADKLLWALRDFRVHGSATTVEASGKDEWSVELKITDGGDLKFRFGQDKTGKPFVGFKDKMFFAQEDLVPALDDAVKSLAPGKGAAAPK